MRNHFGKNGRTIAKSASAALLLALLAGCAAPGMAYRERPAGQQVAYGYADVKIDATHYSIIYTDNNAAESQNYMQLRAAQVAQGAGFPYFTIDKQGTSILKKTETQFDLTQLDSVHNTNGAGPLNAYLPQDPPPRNSSLYYSTGASISLLTADQARGNAKALSASDILAKMGAKS